MTEHFEKRDFELFEELVETTAEPGDRVLDLGCGQMGSLRDLAQNLPCEFVGADIACLEYATPPYALCVACDVSHLPFADGCFDLVISRYVLEHLQSPAPVFREIGRVLKDGGRFVFLAPCAHHYVALIGHLTPFWFHRWCNRLRGFREENTFPTYYRCNSEPKLTSYARIGRLSVVQLKLMELQHDFFSLSMLIRLAGNAYKAIVNACPALKGLRASIIGIMEKTVCSRTRDGYLQWVRKV